MNRDAITIDASEFTGLIDGLVHVLQRTLPMTMKRIGSQIVDIAKDIVPKREGDLKGSLTFQVEDDGMTFATSAGTDLEYAPYVEYGTGHRGYSSGGRVYKGHDSGASYTAGWPGMRAQPYLRPALYDFADVYTGMVDTTIKEAFREASRGSR